MRKLFVSIIIVLSFMMSGNPLFADDTLYKDALNALDKGIKYFHSLSVNGGYIDMYPADGTDTHKMKSAEKRIDVHFPGTSHTGYAFLTAYRTTGEQYYLSCAEEAADALIDG